MFDIFINKLITFVQEDKLNWKNKTPSRSFQSNSGHLLAAAPYSHFTLIVF